MSIENKKPEVNIYDEKDKNEENDFEKEKGKENENNITNWLKQKVDHYKEVFDLSDEDLRNKKILEIGAYDRRFAIALISEGISNDVFSLEPALGSESKEGYAQKDNLMNLMQKIPNELRNEVEKRTIIAEAESVPDSSESYDLVIGKSVPYNSKKQLKKRINELLRIGKEVRFYPIDSKNRSDYESVVESIKKLIPITIECKKIVDCDLKMETGIIHVKEDVLILKKVKKNE